MAPGLAGDARPAIRAMVPGGRVGNARPAIRAMVPGRVGDARPAIRAMVPGLDDVRMRMADSETTVRGYPATGGHGPGRRATGMDPCISAFERMSARHWQATEQACLGGWLLRAAGGFSGRANSALPLGEPGMPAERAVDAVE